MKFIDLNQQYERNRAGIDARIAAVLAHGQFVLGPEVAELEACLATFVGTRESIACSSGTDALLIALMALDIGPGDEVITPAFSFIAAAEVIALLGAVPVFVDVARDTYNLDPTLIEAKVSDRTRALVPVNLFGQCADYEAITAIAERHGLPVIEDAAQSFGATRNGRRSGSFATIGCTSFFPSKPLGCYGDGGACFTDDEALAAAMRAIRVHGEIDKYDHRRLGINGRLDTLQAAILLAKMETFPQEVEARQSAADIYAELLTDAGHAALIPFIAEGNTSVHAQYTLEVDDRDRIRSHLTAAGIPTAVHYPMPVSEQLAFRGDERTGIAMPNSKSASERVLSLPMHPFLTREDQEWVIRALADALRS